MLFIHYEFVNQFVFVAAKSCTYWEWRKFYSIHLWCNCGSSSGAITLTSSDFKFSLWSTTHILWILLRKRKKTNIVFSLFANIQSKSQIWYFENDSIDNLPFNGGPHDPIALIMVMDQRTICVFLYAWQEIEL